MQLKSLFYTVVLVCLSACATTNKARLLQRENVAQSKGTFCEFVSESDFKDVDIEVSLRMAKRCDNSKPFSITGYKRASEDTGILYCCNTGVVNVTPEPAVVSSAKETKDSEEKK